MTYPTLYQSDKDREGTKIFGGLNNTYSSSLGEWAEEDGLTSKYYPVFSPKKKDEIRSISDNELYSDTLGSYITADGVTYTLCYNGISINKDGNEIFLSKDLSTATVKRQCFCEMGDKLLIFLLENNSTEVLGDMGFPDIAMWFSKSNVKKAFNDGTEFDEIVKGTHYDDITDFPRLDFVIEHQNRLWGCRYGLQSADTFVNEIYATGLGTYDKWETYEGISTDSYAISVGTGAEFTGAVSYNGTPLFFKKDRIYRISGSSPAEYTLSETICDGAISQDSIAVMDGVLYYLSARGICAYTGGYPEIISDNFGYDYTMKCYSSCALGGTYYIGYFAKGKNYIAEFDSKCGIWHKTEYPSPVLSLNAQHSNVIATIGYRYYVLGSGNECRNTWNAESGANGLSYPDGKYISKIKIRSDIDTDAYADVYIQYDGDGEWLLQGRMCGSPRGGIQTFVINNIPRRCDTYRLKISGSRKCIILSIAYDFEQGGS